MTQANNEYAIALFMLTQEEKCEKEVSESLTAILQIICENPMYMELLASPSIPKDERIALIDKAFKGNTHEYAVSFLKTLTERDVLRSFEECVEAYQQLCRDADRVTVARVTSALPLTNEEKDRLLTKLEKTLNKSVILDCVYDKTIIGGIIIEADGQIMDGSIRHKLNEVKEVMRK